MDLTDRGSAYRQGVVRCPACGETMRAQPTGNAEPLLCDACGGLWVDWFDGELDAIAIEQEAARVERGTPLPSRPSQPPAGPGTCPRCTRPLGPELFRFSDATEQDLITDVEVLRCPECAGAFVPRGSAHLLRERAREAKTQTPIAALRGLVRQMFGRNRRT
jgi:Zn-finger nucleic acid-binding protein